MIAIAKKVDCGACQIGRIASSGKGFAISNPSKNYLNLLTFKPRKPLKLKGATMLVKEAKIIVGGFNSPGKMPCQSWDLSAYNCNVGNRLAQQEGSVCSDCYARKGNAVRYPVVEASRQRHHEILASALMSEVYREQLLEAFTLLFTKMKPSKYRAKMKGKIYRKFFRWHSSGDVQGDSHLELLCEIARRNPSVLFWLPTREYAVVNQFLGQVPDNLIVRASAHMVDHEAPEGFSYGSAVRNTKVLKGFNCPATNPKNKEAECDSFGCRKCWTAGTVVYHQH